MNEHDYESRVVELARKLGYQAVHARPCREKSGRWTTPLTEKGWPDWCFIRPPRIVFAELKGTHTPLRREQQPFLDTLRACGLEAYLWRAGTTSLQDIADILTAKVTA